MSKPLSAHRHARTEEYSRAVISPFGGYKEMPVPAPPMHPAHGGPADPAHQSRTQLNPAKAAGGHAMMRSRDYGTGAEYNFREAVGGVMPGYAGHRPGARDVNHKMAFGGVPTFNPPSQRTPPGQGARLDNRPTTAFHEYGVGWKMPEERGNEDFRATVGGVKVGYTGFVPGARTHHGSSHVGGLAAVGYRGHLAQRGHEAAVERMHADKELDLSQRTLRTASPVVGYQGHLPKAMDAFGTSSWRATSPDVARETDALYSA